MSKLPQRHSSTTDEPPRALLQQFYISEEQSLYLMRHEDAERIRQWVQLCQDQLRALGFHDVHFIGKGAYGFVFGADGTDTSRPSHQTANDNTIQFTPSETDQAYVFKFSRINLPQAVQDRLEEEAWMQARVEHPNIPKVIEFTRIQRQSVLITQRAQGLDLDRYVLKHGPLAPRLVIKIALQLIDLLLSLRHYRNHNGEPTPLVHGDIKPSNIVFDPEREQIKLVDWGSSVFAQEDPQGLPVGPAQMTRVSEHAHQTNAKLGDVYFIGEEQLNGAPSSPRFDEQGLAATLYAIASGQACRYGYEAIPATALGLPRPFAEGLQQLLCGSPSERQQAGDQLLRSGPLMAHWVMLDLPRSPLKPQIPIWHYEGDPEIETVVYSSRLSFLRQGQADPTALAYVGDVELEKYYKNFMDGMGPTERAFMAAVSRLGRYPIVGGLAIRWTAEQLLIDSSLNLHDSTLKLPFIHAVNTLITLARALHHEGVFKCCMFDAKATRHLQRDNEQSPFTPPKGWHIPYTMAAITPADDDQSRHHSYFEDGDDPDELLQLPSSILSKIAQLNEIRHTGLIIFEVLPTHLKLHSHYVLLDASRETEFSALLNDIVQAIPDIRGLGVSGFMKMPYKNTRHFTKQARLPDDFYPRNPKACEPIDSV